MNGSFHKVTDPDTSDLICNVAGNGGGTMSARDIHGNTHIVSKADMVFRVSVYGVVLESDNVLLVPQWDGFDMPGGAVEIGESLEEAVMREVFEETGMQVCPSTSIVLHAAEDFFVHPTDGKPYHCVLLYFPCQVVGGELSDAGFGQDEKAYSQMARWVPITQVDGLRFHNPVDSPAIIMAACKLREGTVGVPDQHLSRSVHGPSRASGMTAIPSLRR